MGSTRTLAGIVLFAWLVLGAAIQPLPAQGKGQDKGQGKSVERRPNERRASSPRANDVQPGKGQAKGRQPNDRANDRANTRANERGNQRAANPRGNEGRGKAAASDQRIERRVEQEFAGDVTRRRGLGIGRFHREVNVAELRPSLRRFLDDDAPSRRAAAGAIARAHLRGLDDDALVLRPVAHGVHILNNQNVLLVDLDREGARDLGWWDVVPIGDDVSEGAPAFCRSGEGHPVFGRQWCVNKGFGLGGADYRWARTRRLEDVVFLREPTAGDLTRDALLSLLGPVVLDRLGLHAITLGYTQPITGRWISTDPAEGRVLLLTSGGQPVAEIVDTTRDDRADVLLVALRDW